jgi:hypothetical protein
MRPRKHWLGLAIVSMAAWITGVSLGTFGLMVAAGAGGRAGWLCVLVLVAAVPVVAAWMVHGRADANDAGSMKVRLAAEAIPLVGLLAGSLLAMLLCGTAHPFSGMVWCLLLAAGGYGFASLLAAFGIGRAVRVIAVAVILAAVITLPLWQVPWTSLAPDGGGTSLHIAVLHMNPAALALADTAGVQPMDLPALYFSKTTGAFSGMQVEAFSPWSSTPGVACIELFLAGVFARAVVAALSWLIVRRRELARQAATL